MRFLSNRYGRVLTVVLAAQAALFYAAVSRAEYVPSAPPLASFPATFSGWTGLRDFPIDADTLEVLKADDTLDRAYANPSTSQAANLFIAFFKTQRTGQSPHSPKNCLPGSGWEPVATGLVSIPVAGRQSPITANKFVVSHGEDKSVVIYWYQSHNRIIASEYSAKFWLVADSIRYHRSDTALVRVVVPVTNNNIEAATETGMQFVEAAFPELLKQLPS